MMIGGTKSRLLLLSGLVTVTLFVGSQTSHIEAALPSSLCNNAACSRLAALISEAANASAQPCVDFHDYVCGGWSRMARSLTMAEYTREAFIENVAHRARSVPVPYVHQTAEEKAVRYFSACDGVVSGAEDHLDDVKRLLINGGIVWPDAETNPDVLDSMFYMSLIARVPILLRMSLQGSGESKTISISSAMPTFLAAGRLERETTKVTAKKFFWTLYAAFSSTGSAGADRRFAVLVDQENCLVASLSAALANTKSSSATTSDIHHWAKMSSKQRWQVAFYKYWKISSHQYVPVAIENRDYFWAVFAHYRRFGDAQTMDLFGWLCVRALFPFTNRKIVSSYYASPAFESKHRTLCYDQTDKIMHYAFQSAIALGMTYTPLLDDVTSIVTRILTSTADTLTAGWLFFGECHPHSHSKDMFLGELAKYNTSYTAQAYASFPDMTNDPLINWIETASAAPSAFNYLLPAGELVHGQNVQIDQYPIKPAYLDVPWYALDAPRTVKLAGLGSRVAVQIFRELFSSKELCLGLKKSSEVLWKCVVDREGEDAERLQDARDDVLVSILASGVLWPVLEDLMTGSSSPPATIQSLSEIQLFFVVGCLLLCGKEHSEAECNLPLKDNVRFARAFYCRRGTPMHPKRTCSHASS